MAESDSTALRIAYVTVGKADDIHERSGLNAAIRSSLLRQGCDVHDVDRLGTEHSIALRVRRRLYASLLGQAYALERSPSVVSRWSRIATERVAQLPQVDAVVSTGTLPVAFLGGAQPLAIWADATFHSLRTTYPDYANFSRASLDEGDLVEQAALNRASLICYASDWAAADAAAYYGISRRKIRVVPFGANCDSPYSGGADAASSVAERAWSVVRFVFVGVDWQRKGGDLAVAIVRRLNELGRKSMLSVIGCTPPGPVRSLPFVECLGFLSKKAAGDRDRLAKVLLHSHFLLVPTLADCFGLVFAEASAFALPSIARSVGGVARAVRNGCTGLLLPADAGAEAYCQALQPLLDDRSRYAAMCAAAYQDYAGRLNWHVAGARFVAELRSALSGRRAEAATSQGGQ